MKPSGSTDAAASGNGMRQLISGAVLGAVIVPALVFAFTAVMHWVRYGNWSEFWGLILAIRLIAYGLVIGAIVGFLSGRTRRG
jgi:hypothetical protein